MLWEAGTEVRALGPAGHQRVRPCLKGKGTAVKQATCYLPQAFVCEHAGAQHTCLYTTHTKQGVAHSGFELTTILPPQLPEW